MNKLKQKMKLERMKRFACTAKLGQTKEWIRLTKLLLSLRIEESLAQEPKSKSNPQVEDVDVVTDGAADESVQFFTSCICPSSPCMLSIVMTQVSVATPVGLGEEIS
jgi:hypothetical protein